MTLKDIIDVFENNDYNKFGLLVFSETPYILPIETSSDQNNHRLRIQSFTSSLVQQDVVRSEVTPIWSVVDKDNLNIVITKFKVPLNMTSLPPDA